MGIVVYVLGRAKPAKDTLKPLGEMGLPKPGSEGFWITEQQSLVLVQLHVRQESNVRPQIRHLRHDVCFYRLLDLDNLAEARQVWR